LNDSATRSQNFDDRRMTIGDRPCSRVSTRDAPPALLRSCAIAAAALIPIQQPELHSSRRAKDRASHCPYSVVHSLISIRMPAASRFVRVIDAQYKTPIEFRPDIFLVAARPSSPRAPPKFRESRISNGLANASGELGHNLMDHHMGAEAAARNAPVMQDKLPFGNRPNGIF